MNILITGAGNGIGFALTSLLAKNKTHKIIAVSRNTDKLNKSVSDGYSNIMPFQCDITIAEQRHALQHFAQTQFSSLDVLVKNAGQLINKPFETLTETDYVQMLTINCVAPALIIKDLLPLLLKNTEGSQKSHVVNISSMGGFQGSIKFPGLSAYSMSKAAMANLTECLAAEYAEKGIVFNTLALGAVNTPMLLNAFPSYTANQSPEEMAVFIADFAINGSKYFNGKVLQVSTTTP